MKRNDMWQIREFTYGFIVIHNGKRVAIVEDEDRAERIVKRGKRGAKRAAKR